MSLPSRLSLPVTVVLARRQVHHGAWSVPSWRAVGVLMGERLSTGSAEAVPIRSDGDEEHFLWSGLALALYRDATEAYHTNLTGDRPALYVLCHEGSGGDVRPVAVTADPHEAGAFVEGDARVLDAPIPAEIGSYLEAFIVQHHRPAEPGKGKRKREDWSEQAGK